MGRLVSVSIALFLAVITAQASFAAGPVDPDQDYDRLDGTGTSGKKVDVIEWEGNLEVHVYPKGSLVGLALKLDKRDKNKPVMVIGYRFDNAPKTQLIRRAILGIDLHEGFKAYQDPSADDYDKVVVSNNGLSSDLVAYRLDPEPKQLYPEGDPRNNTAAPKTEVAEMKHPAKVSRAPASAHSSSDDGVIDDATDGLDEDDGTIRPFFIRKSGSARPRSAP